MSALKANDPTQLFGGTAPVGNTNGTAGQRLGPDGKPLPDAKIWFNIGQPDGVDSEGKELFQGLPTGLAFDTMRKHVINPKDTPEFQAIQQDRNDFYDLVAEMVADLKPGETRILNLKIQAQRVKDNAPVEVDQDVRAAKLARMRALLHGTPAPVAEEPAAAKK